MLGLPASHAEMRLSQRGRGAEGRESSRFICVYELVNTSSQLSQNLCHGGVRNVLQNMCWVCGISPLDMLQSMCLGARNLASSGEGCAKRISGIGLFQVKPRIFLNWSFNKRVLLSTVMVICILRSSLVGPLRRRRTGPSPVWFRYCVGPVHRPAWTIA